MSGLRPSPGWQRRQGRTLAIVVAALTGATLAVAAVQAAFGIPYAAPVYLLAVLVVGLFGGTIAAIATAVASFLLYDFFFVQPLYTLTVSDPNEWLNLLLFLVVAVVIGRLAALEAARSAEVSERAREAVALFRISRSLATSDDLVSGAGAVVEQLTGVTGMDRVWLGLGSSRTEERIVADSGGQEPLPVATMLVVLQRKPGDEPATWARTHVGSAGGPGAPRRRRGSVVYRVRIEVPGDVLGSLWALRAGSEVEPDRAATRILSAAADQLGQAVNRDRLGRAALDAEVIRRSEALKTALLDSVSHDLRTPLATIRAAAGSMLDPGVEWSAAERTDALHTIDAEAERMNRLVRDLLDLSRIEGGMLHPELEPHDLDELVGRVVGRMPPGRAIEVELPDDLPPLLVDDTYLDEVLTNLVENGVRHGGDRVRIRASVPDERVVEILVEDDGPGVAAADLPHLFEKFYRAGPSTKRSRQGMGVGLTVAQGLTQAMGGSIIADRSPLGGLAFHVRLPAVELPGENGAENGPPADEEDR